MPFVHILGHFYPHIGPFLSKYWAIFVNSFAPGKLAVAALPVQPFFTLLARKHTTMKKK